MAGKTSSKKADADIGTFAVRLRNGGALMGFFDNRERAERYLATTVPLYIERGYFTDKTLCQADFEIIKGGRNG